MTKQVRTVYRRHRRGTVAIVLTALAAGLVFAVYPAGAANEPSGVGRDPGRPEPRRSGERLCGRIVRRHRTSPHRQPRRGPSRIPDRCAVRARGERGQHETRVHRRWRRVHGRRLVIKGGTKSTHYDYIAAGSRRSQGYQPARTDKGTGYYALSHVSFCSARQSRTSVVTSGRQERERDSADGVRETARPAGDHGHLPTIRLHARTDTTDGAGNAATTWCRIFRSGTPTRCARAIRDAVAPDGWVQSRPTQAVCSGDTPNGYRDRADGRFAQQ